MKVNYDKCKYRGSTEDEMEGVKYPCEHPNNFEGDCPLNNKKENQKDECSLQ